MSPPWRFAAASAAGTAHLRRALPCQDASLCRVLAGGESGPVLVAVGADGAGSASRAEVGAGLTCAHMLHQIEVLLGAGGALRDITRGRIELWLAGLQDEVARRARAAGLRPRDFASTLVAAIVGDDCAVFVQVGDGAIVIAPHGEPEAFSWVFWPANDEHENLTFFATAPRAAEHLEHAVLDGVVDEVALFTDGLQRLALHDASRTAQTPFLRSLLQPLRAAQEPSRELSTQLAAFLDSPGVNARTEDDKTLILATRRVSDPAEPPHTASDPLALW